MTIDAAFNLALQHQQAGQLREAEQLYRQILAQNPNHAPALHLLGVIAAGAARNDVAAELISRSIAVNPSIADVHSDLATALKHAGRIDEAVTAYRRAIALDPNLPEAHCNLGITLHETGALDEAITELRSAIALKPDYAEAHSALLFALHLHPAYDAKAIALEHRKWNEKFALSLMPRDRNFNNDREPDRKLRIGYVSPDFCQHVVGTNMLPVFVHHDRERFEITGYANVHRPDAMIRQFQEHATNWRDITSLSDEAVARMISDDGVDILVDLALHTNNNRLLVFARKSAPVQVTFAGYPASTGLTAIDYRLSDPYLDPAGTDESIYSEKTIRLPHSFWCYQAVEDMDVAVNSLPAITTGGVTFGCLNKFSKINESTLSLWAEVMRRVQNSRLILLAEPGSHRQRVTAVFSRAQVDPRRIRFVSRLPRKAYLEIFHDIDIGLDTFPYNGHTTSLDSLWMSVPVITRVGETTVSRAGWSQLSNLGLTELAAKSGEEFVTIAVALANDLPRLAELRATLRQRMEQSPIMDAVGFTRAIESAYRQMWSAWCNSAKTHEPGLLR